MLPSYRNQSVDLDHIETNQLTGFYRMGTLALTFMIGCKYYKRNHRLWRYISLYSNLGRYIHRIYRFESNFHISPSVLSRGLKVVPSYSSSSLLASFDDSSKLLCRHCLRFLLRYFCIDNRIWWYLLSSFSFPSKILALFWCNRFMSILFIETFALTWATALGSFFKISS